MADLKLKRNDAVFRTVDRKSNIPVDKTRADKRRFSRWSHYQRRSVWVLPVARSTFRDVIRHSINAFGLVAYEGIIRREIIVKIFWNSTRIRLTNSRVNIRFFSMTVVYTTSFLRLSFVKHA